MINDPTVDEWMKMINEHNRDLNKHIPKGVRWTRIFDPDFKGWTKEKPKE